MADINKFRAMPEQITYANILFMGAWIGIGLMILTYFLYVAGLLTPHVPLEVVVQNWDKPVHEYLEITNSPTGWNWVALLNTGDFLNFVGIALLAVLTIFCYMFLVVGYLKRKDMAYAIIAITEILVLTLAASGILGSGGH